MKTKTRFEIYLWLGYIVAVCNIVGILLFRHSLLILILLLVGTLVACGVLERWMAGNKPRKSSKGPAMRRWFDLGEIEISGRLLFSDDYAFGNVEELLVPSGIYRIEVERFSKGEVHYVAGFKLTGQTSVDQYTPNENRVAVDTGFMVLVVSEPNKEMAKVAEDAQEMILSERNRELDVERLLVNGVCVGLITYTGLGDDIYKVRCTTTAENRPQIECKFIRHLAEIRYGA